MIHGGKPTEKKRSLRDTPYHDKPRSVESHLRESRIRGVDWAHALNVDSKQDREREFLSSHFEQGNVDSLVTI